ncbi:MAG: hypothetical protein EHM80_15155 [Nitrospiraceae bacterium]|nr:MAG: hypothetical protein EHM80_15155 [Nitrospiraceae bacterium]
MGYLYLSLWKRLDLLSGDAKWLEIRPVDPSDLKSHVERGIADVRGLRDPDILRIVEQEYTRVQQIFDEANAGNLMGEMDESEWGDFKAFLRDQGLRYSEAADDTGESNSFSAGNAGD